MQFAQSVLRFLPVKRFYKYLLKRLLGSLLIEDINVEDLEVQLYQGTICMHNLKLDPGKLNKLLAGDKAGPGVVVADGRVGKLKLCIPWRNVLAERSKIYFEDVQLVVRCAAESSASPRPPERPPPPSELREARTEQGVESLSRLVQHIVNKMEVVLERVHVVLWSPSAELMVRGQLDQVLVYSELDRRGGERMPSAGRSVRIAGWCVGTAHAPPHLEGCDLAKVRTRLLATGEPGCPPCLARVQRAREREEPKELEVEVFVHSVRVLVTEDDVGLLLTLLQGLHADALVRAPQQPVDLAASAVFGPGDQDELWAELYQLFEREEPPEPGEELDEKEAQAILEQQRDACPVRVRVEVVKAVATVVLGDKYAPPVGEGAVPGATSLQLVVDKLDATKTLQAQALQIRARGASTKLYIPDVEAFDICSQSDPSPRSSLHSDINATGANWATCVGTRTEASRIPKAQAPAGSLRSSRTPAQAGAPADRLSDSREDMVSAASHSGSAGSAAQSMQESGLLSVVSQSRRSSGSRPAMDDSGLLSLASGSASGVQPIAMDDSGLLSLASGSASGVQPSADSMVSVASVPVSESVVSVPASEGLESALQSATFASLPQSDTFASLPSATFASLPQSDTFASLPQSETFASLPSETFASLPGAAGTPLAAPGSELGLDEPLGASSAGSARSGSPGASRMQSAASSPARTPRALPSPGSPQSAASGPKSPASGMFQTMITASSHSGVDDSGVDAAPASFASEVAVDEVARGRAGDSDGWSIATDLSVLLEDDKPPKVGALAGDLEQQFFATSAAELVKDGAVFGKRGFQPQKPFTNGFNVKPLVVLAASEGGVEEPEGLRIPKSRLPFCLWWTFDADENCFEFAQATVCADTQSIKVLGHAARARRQAVEEALAGLPASPAEPTPARVLVPQLRLDILVPSVDPNAVCDRLRVMGEGVSVKGTQSTIHTASVWFQGETSELELLASTRLDPLGRRVPTEPCQVAVERHEVGPLDADPAPKEPEKAPSVASEWTKITAKKPSAATFMRRPNANERRPRAAPPLDVSGTAAVEVSVLLPRVYARARGTQLWRLQEGLLRLGAQLAQAPDAAANELAWALTLEIPELRCRLHDSLWCSLLGFAMREVASTTGSTKVVAVAQDARLAIDAPGAEPGTQLVDAVAPWYVPLLGRSEVPKVARRWPQEQQGFPQRERAPAHPLTARQRCERGQKDWRDFEALCLHTDSRKLGVLAQTTVRVHFSRLALAIHQETLPAFEQLGQFLAAPSVVNADVPALPGTFTVYKLQLLDCLVDACSAEYKPDAFQDAWRVVEHVQQLEASLGFTPGDSTVTEKALSGYKVTLESASTYLVDAPHHLTSSKLLASSDPQQFLPDLGYARIAELTNLTVFAKHYAPLASTHLDVSFDGARGFVCVDSLRCLLSLAEKLSPPAQQDARPARARVESLDVLPPEQAGAELPAWRPSPAVAEEPLLPQHKPRINVKVGGVKKPADKVPLPPYLIEDYVQQLRQGAGTQLNSSLQTRQNVEAMQRAEQRARACVRDLLDGGEGEPEVAEGAAVRWLVGAQEVNVVSDYAVTKDPLKSGPEPNVCRLQVSGKLVDLCLVAGLDFEDDLQAKMGRLTQRQRPKRKEQKQVSLRLEGLKLRGEKWADKPKQSLGVSVQDLGVIDGVQSSVYSHVLAYGDKHRPRPTSLAMLRLSLDVQQEEGAAAEVRCDAKLLPIQITIDQDTLEFMVESARRLRSSTFDIVDEEDEVEPADEEAEAERAPAWGQDLFFRSLKLSALLVRVDYRARRVDVGALRRGDVGEFLNVIPVEGLEVAFAPVTLKACFGAESVGEGLVSAWTQDLTRSHVLLACLKGVPPIRSVLNVTSGVADLVRMPVREFQREVDRQAAERSSRQLAAQALEREEATSVVGRWSQALRPYTRCVTTRVLTRGVLRGTQSFFGNLSSETLELADQLLCASSSVLRRLEGTITHAEPQRQPNRWSSPAAYADPLPRQRGPGREEDEWSWVDRGAAEFNEPTSLGEGLQAARTTIERSVSSAVTSARVGPARQTWPATLLEPAAGLADAASLTVRGVRGSLGGEQQRSQPHSKFKPPG